MSGKNKIRILVLAVLGIIAAVVIYLMNAHIPVLEPAGEVAEKQRNLIYVGLALSLIIVVPVFIMLGVISWKYRESNHKTGKVKYDPTWDRSKAIEFTWWAVPSAIILVLAVITWNSSHDLDPFKPLNSSKKPVRIEVVALQWKWLFIYPEEKIAAVNYFEMPVGTPVNFRITSDAPMNSFWIPQLGGQIYAMSGMSTKLHLIADKAGAYDGKSANISGDGFSRMNFVAKASSDSGYRHWIEMVKASTETLSMDSYNKLAQPDIPDVPIYYSTVADGLYDRIIDKYMSPDHSEHSDQPDHKHHEGMEM